MALQGTLETFALPDVLRLLASTKKTGCYRLDGDRGWGRLWVSDGQVIAGDVSSSPAVVDPREVAFELLRFEDGQFIFDADAAPDEPGEPIDVETVLADADTMLSEWKDVAGVVPSLDHWVALNPELPTDEVSIRADTWISVVAIGDGKTVGQLGAMLGLGELPVSRSVKDLIDLGLVALGDPPVGPGTPSAAVHESEGPGTVTEYEAPMYSETSFDAPPYEQSASEADYEISFEGLAGAGPEAPAIEFGPAVDEDEGGFHPFDPQDLVIEAPTFGDVATPTPASTGGDPTDAAEIARQLANLSPKAAKAVAAAAKATTQEEREAALAEVDETEDPINRELLLKFLGSVNS